MPFADRDRGRYSVKPVARILILAGVLTLLGAGPAGGRVAAGPAVDIHSAAGLAPDGRSIGVQVLASCPERWTVVEAVVRVSQAGASGQASFPLTCIGSMRSFSVNVPASGAAFQLGSAQVTASVVINRGKTARADDSQVVTVQPTVLVELAETAQLESGGGAVVMDVAVACPAGTNGLQSSLVVSQEGRSMGSGSYVPVCDGASHTFTVRVVASQGLYHTGIAQALTFATIEFGGETFYGIDDDGALDILS
jgi:hypothetical protein